jgi:hypothetical protein
VLLPLLTCHAVIIARALIMADVHRLPCHLHPARWWIWGVTAAVTATSTAPGVPIGAMRTTWGWPLVAVCAAAAAAASQVPPACAALAAVVSAALGPSAMTVAPCTAAGHNEATP